MKKVLDISKHQGNINFIKMNSRDIEGVMCRCSYSGLKDSKFEEYYDQLTKNNINFGAYAFCTWHYTSFSINKASAMIAAECESNKVINILKSKKISGPVAIDLELESGQSTVLTKEEMTSVSNLYLDKLKNAGYTPIVYCSISWLFDHLIYSKLKYPLWIAYFNKDGLTGNQFPNTKYGSLMDTIKDRIWMWQYTSHGDGEYYGVSSERIDINHCYRNFGTKRTNTPYHKNIETPTVYVVKKNDNLTIISNQYGVTLNNLLSVNPQIKNPNLIHIGDKINIPTKKNSQVKSKIKVGSKVKVKSGSKTYDNKSIASFVFNNTYRVDQLKGNRAVLDLKGICTPVNIDDLLEV